MCGECAKFHTVARSEAANTDRRDHAIIVFSHSKYMGDVLRAHSVSDESHIQRNANRKAATIGSNAFFNQTHSSW